MITVDETQEKDRILLDYRLLMSTTPFKQVGSITIELSQNGEHITKIAILESQMQLLPL